MSVARARFASPANSRAAVAVFTVALLFIAVAAAVPVSKRADVGVNIGSLSMGVPYGWVLQPDVGPQAGESVTFVDRRRPSRVLRVFQLNLNIPPGTLSQPLPPEQVLADTFRMITGVALPPDPQISRLDTPGTPMAAYVGRYAQPLPLRLGGDAPVGLVGAAIATDGDPRVYNVVLLRDRVFGAFEEPDERLRRHAEVFARILRTVEPRSAEPALASAGRSPMAGAGPQP